MIHKILSTSTKYIFGKTFQLLATIKITFIAVFS